MKHQKTYEAALKDLGFEQNPNNKNLWIKTEADQQYGVSMKGVKPDAFIIGADFEQVRDETNETIRTTLSALTAAVDDKNNSKKKEKENGNDKSTPGASDTQEQTDKTPAEHIKENAPGNETRDEPSETAQESAPQKDMTECAVCKNLYNTGKMYAIGDQDQYLICESCNEGVATGDIDVQQFYTIPDEPMEIIEPEYDEGRDLLPETKQAIVNEGTITTITETTAPVQRMVTHTIQNIVPQLCECGKIKIGMKGESKQGKYGGNFRMPTKLDHFIVTTTAKNREGDFIKDEEIMAAIGENCTSIPIRLLYDDPELNFPTSYAHYDSAACKCRGDGVNARTADGKIIPCDPETCQAAIDKKCKPNGVLSVLLEDAPTVGGVYKFRTTSWNSIRNILTSMEFIKGLTGGMLKGIPLTLTVRPKTTVIPGTSQTTTIYIVNVEYPGSIKSLMTQARDELSVRADSMALQQSLEDKARMLLDAPTPEDECRDIVEEFYPDTAKEELNR